MEKKTRILFITVNGWNNTTGTATIPSIIEGYPPENVACIFIRPDLPNSPVCNLYYSISEADVIKSIYRRNVLPGNVVSCSREDIQEMDNERKKRVRLKKIPVFLGRYARDLFWKFGKWDNDKLKTFIRNFNPDVIAFPAEGILSFLRLCETIVDYAQKPYVLFFWDDNFTLKNHGISIYRIFLRHKIASLAKNCAGSFAITPKMEKECQDYFHIVPTQITKPVVENLFVTEKSKYSFPIKILYAGSLYIDRDKTIEYLIQAIKEVNINRCYFCLDIYTNSQLSETEKKKYNIDGVVSLHPGVKKEQIFELQDNADVLLFVEAIKGRYKNSARLSFSTKITDYLSANRAILAIGPNDIAPIEYLRDNKIAIIASDETEIKDKLNLILMDKDTILKEYAQRAYVFGREKHSRQIIYESFCSTIEKAVNGM